MGSRQKGGDHRLLLLLVFLFSSCTSAYASFISSPRASPKWRATTSKHRHSSSPSWKLGATPQGERPLNPQELGSSPPPPPSSHPLVITIGLEVKACLPELQDDQWDRLDQLLALVCEWNEKVNIVSRKDIHNIVPNHLVPCLGLVKLLLQETEARRGQGAKGGEGDKEAATFRPLIMDVGCGGGFPGLPAAICLPEAKFVLVDSVGKKVMVVKDMAKRLGLKNVAVVHGRAEQFGPEVQVDWVIGRAVTNLPRFLGWCKDRLKPPGWSSTGLENGILYIKGGPILDETVKKEDYDVRLVRASEHPSALYPITDLLACYQGDKAVLHYSSNDLFAAGVRPGAVLEDPTKPKPTPPRDGYQQRGRGRSGGGYEGYGGRSGRSGSPPRDRRGGGPPSSGRRPRSSSPPSQDRRRRYEDEGWS